MCWTAVEGGEKLESNDPREISGCDPVDCREMSTCSVDMYVYLYLFIA